MSTLTLASMKRKTKEELCDEWLHSFPAFQHHRLLKIGIDVDLKAIYQEEPRPFGFIKVRHQIHRRIIKPWYRELLANRENETRYDLDGNPSFVEPPEAA